MSALSVSNLDSVEDIWSSIDFISVLFFSKEAFKFSISVFNSSIFEFNSKISLSICLYFPKCSLIVSCGE